MTVVFGPYNPSLMAAKLIDGIGVDSGTSIVVLLRCGWG